jgi:hypothetical protein
MKPSNFIHLGAILQMVIEDKHKRIATTFSNTSNLSVILPIYTFCGGQHHV